MGKIKSLAMDIAEELNIPFEDVTNEMLHTYTLKKQNENTIIIKTTNDIRRRLLAHMDANKTLEVRCDVMMDWLADIDKEAL